LFLDDLVHLLDSESISSGDTTDTEQQQLAVVVQLLRTFAGRLEKAKEVSVRTNSLERTGGHFNTGVGGMCVVSAKCEEAEGVDDLFRRGKLDLHSPLEPLRFRGRHLGQEIGCRGFPFWSLDWCLDVVMEGLWGFYLEREVQYPAGHW
jgi:hypothetical protein